jgi:hypothetical protein
MSFRAACNARPGSIVDYDVRERKELDVTLRDAKKSERDRLDSVRNSKGADRIISTTENRSTVSPVEITLDSDTCGA